MFGIGIPELIIIMVIALIVIGPSKLPELARALGKGMAEFKKATQDIKQHLDVEEELGQAKEDLVDSISGLNQPQRPETDRPAETGKQTHEGGGDIAEPIKKQGEKPANPKHGAKQDNPVKEKQEDD